MTVPVTPAPASAPPRPRWARALQALPRDKSDTLLLLGAALLVLAPHMAHLPAWTSLVCGATLLWRAAITLRGTRMPPAWLLLPVSVAAMGGVLASFHTLLGRDAGVAMLVLLVAFKMLEMHARRDLFVVVFLCFFLVLTNFFYSQSIGTALLMVASIVALLCAQLTFQFTGAVPSLARRLGMSVRILAMAAPLALLLLFGFPRIQGPLWGMPGDANGGRSGLSDSMSPGNLSSLAQSDQVAFRVKFIDPAPPPAKLYWRGVVLGDFDGRTWTQVHPVAKANPHVAITVRGARIRHQVTLEGSSNRWLFALEMPEQLPNVAGNPSTVSSELELTAANPIEQTVRYEVASYPDFSLDAGPVLEDAARWLTLPRGFNPLARQAGLALLRAHAPVDRVRAVLGQFAHGGYVYTLEPPLLGRDAVDEFLYGSRAGFCEHYAGAFVFLMRAAGVPARVVTGYQGGEVNPVDGVMTVRQSDAHAWAEVWLGGRGWLRIDPTAAVSPARVLQGARALPRREPFGLRQLGQLIDFGGTGAGWAAQLRNRIGAINNGWNQWVLDYTPQRQRGLLDAAGAALLHWRNAGALALLALVLFLARARRRRRETDPIDALYSALCLRMSRSGVERARDEGPSAYAARLDGALLAPEKKAAAARFLALYSAYKYAARAPDPRLAATLKRLLSES